MSTTNVPLRTQTPGLSSGEEYFTNTSEQLEHPEQQMTDISVNNQPMTTEITKSKELSLSKPTLFNGDPNKSRKFLQDCILYMGINKDIYDAGPKKIAFILSYMQEGNVGVWNQKFVQDKLNLDTGDITLPTHQ